MLVSLALQLYETGLLSCVVIGKYVTVSTFRHLDLFRQLLFLTRACAFLPKKRNKRKKKRKRKMKMKMKRNK